MLNLGEGEKMSGLSVRIVVAAGLLAVSELESRP